MLDWVSPTSRHRATHRASTLRRAATAVAQQGARRTASQLCHHRHSTAQHRALARRWRDRGAQSLLRSDSDHRYRKPVALLSIGKFRSSPACSTSTSGRRFRIGSCVRIGHDADFWLPINQTDRPAHYLRGGPKRIWSDRDRRRRVARVSRPRSCRAVSRRRRCGRGQAGSVVHAADVPHTRSSRRPARVNFESLPEPG